MTRVRWVGLTLSLIVVLAAATFFFWPPDYAARIIQTCATSSYPPACYDTEIPKLMDEGISMEEAFKITKLVQQRVGPEYAYCHTLGHNLSEKETAKDPSSWASVVARCPEGMCANGCMHGAMQARFGKEALSDDELSKSVPVLAEACSTPMTGLEHTLCYHYLGHLFAYAANADLVRTLDACDAVALIEGSDSKMRCYEGAFMQLFQPMDAEDAALMHDIPVSNRAAADQFCSLFSGERKAACHRESWPLSRDLMLTPGGIATFCSANPEPQALQDCYNLLTNILPVLVDFDVGKIADVCDALPPNRMAQCFAHTASQCVTTDHDLIDTAAALCTEAAARGVGERCYQELLFQSTYSYDYGSPRFLEFCAVLPAPYDERCRNGEGKDVPRYILDL